MKEWSRELVDPGVCEILLDSFCDFAPLITNEFNNTRRYVWRGQRCEDWPLESSLARRIKRNKKQTAPAKLAELQLTRFRKAARGRRGTNAPKLSDDELWALGQHFGLATPLLDWTVSPYVALYFAFAEPGNTTQTENRVVYALHRPEVASCSKEIVKGFPDQAHDTIRFFEPDSDENARVLSQRGLFSVGPVSSSIDEWVQKHLGDGADDIIVRILVPDNDRAQCLKMLNRMNINHLTLFPDLIGAAEFTNIHLDVLNY